jgi:hypothetical protein
MTQLQLHFEPGLTAQFKGIEDVLSAVVYSSRQGLQGCASEADQSPSELSRRLNKTDALPLRVQDMTAILDATKDMRPVYWLIERYIQDPEATKNAAVQQLANYMPVIAALIEQASAIKVRAVK